MSAIAIYHQLRADLARRFKRLTAALPRPASTRLPLDAGADAVVRCDCMREVADVHGGRLCRLQEMGWVERPLVFLGTIENSLPT